MFQPISMSEVDFLVLERDILTVTRAVADQGSLHQLDISRQTDRDTPTLAQGTPRELIAAYTAAERRVLALMKLLDVREGRPSDAEEANPSTDLDGLTHEIEDLERETEELGDRLEQEQEQLRTFRFWTDRLEPISDLDLDLGKLWDLNYTFFQMGVMPAASVERLRTSLMGVPFVLLPLRQEEDQVLVGVFGVQRDAEVLNRATRSAYFQPIPLLEQYRGTPDEIISSLQTDMHESEGHIAELRAELAETHGARAKRLSELLWQIRVDRLLLEAMSRFGHQRHAYLIAGWVPTARVDELVKRLQLVTQGRISAQVTRPKRAEAMGRAPIALKDPGFLRAFQQLVTTYGWPSYGELDPTFLMILTFPLIFGMMFGDVGHGLLVLSMGLVLASGMVKRLRQASSFAGLLISCGVTSTVFGILYGSVFGLENILPAIWLRPMENILDILIYSIAIGVILLNIGFLLGLANAWRMGDWERLLFDHTGLAGLCFYWAGIGTVLGLSGAVRIPAPVLVTMMILSASAMLLKEPLGKLLRREHPVVPGGLVTYLVQAGFELFETIIALFSNTLSYVRMGAFAVAHGGLTAVIFILADLLGGGTGPVYWLILVLGNLFIVGFEGLIVGIQTLRLEYYEFFSKFFFGGGRPYQPLSLARDEE